MIDAVIDARSPELDLCPPIKSRGCCTLEGGGRKVDQKFKFILELHVELEGSWGFVRLCLKKKEMARRLHGQKHFGAHFVEGET